ncbi:MAG: hypothetical protein F6K53_20280 [Moorea sp. SIO4A1]|uniref:hypothetical protein n=1 Tax=Moorena sp. SIO4A1 TaxID=2607835 RepID=UPI00144EE863|nr:hypothetical protein [Moorena sp. SIO4A1]NEQ59610.1 hypothetical protein [Moorena sp. SIO4A1]
MTDIPNERLRVHQELLVEQRDFYSDIDRKDYHKVKDEVSIVVQGAHVAKIGRVWKLQPFDHIENYMPTETLKKYLRVYKAMAVILKDHPQCYVQSLPHTVASLFNLVGSFSPELGTKWGHILGTDVKKELRASLYWELCNLKVQIMGDAHDWYRDLYDEEEEGRLEYEMTIMLEKADQLLLGSDRGISHAWDLIEKELGYRPKTGHSPWLYFDIKALQEYVRFYQILWESVSCSDSPDEIIAEAFDTSEPNRINLTPEPACIDPEISF